MVLNFEFHYCLSIISIKQGSHCQSSVVSVSHDISMSCIAIFCEHQWYSLFFMLHKQCSGKILVMWETTMWKSSLQYLYIIQYSKSLINYLTIMLPDLCVELLFNFRQL